MSYYAVIDTNVLVSFLLKKNSIPSLVVELVGRYEIIPILHETIRDFHNTLKRYEQLEQAIKSYNLKELNDKNNIVKLFDYDSKQIISELRNEHYLGKYYIADCCKICFTDKNYKIYCEYHGSYDGEIPPSEIYFKNKRKDTILYYLINYGFILLLLFGIIRCFKKSKNSK